MLNRDKTQQMQDLHLLSDLISEELTSLEYTNAQPRADVDADGIQHKVHTERLVELRAIRINFEDVAHRQTYEVP